MDETELLEALDRRAADAVTSLDGRLVDDEPSPLPVETGRRRRSAPLVAAAVVVVALLALGLALGGSDEAGSVADDRDVPIETTGGLTRLALADPASLGYEVRAAFDGTTPAGITPSDFDPDFSAHVPAGSHPATASIVLSATLPAEARDVGGEVVDIGGPEALLRVLGPQVQLQWGAVDGQVRLLTSVHISADELLDIARGAIATDWDGTAALPGHDLLHRGPMVEFSPTLAYAAAGSTGRHGIAYDRPGHEDDFVIGWSTGDHPEDRWAARRAMATETGSFEIRGRPVAYASLGPQSEGELSWLEPDGTLVEVVFHGDPADLVQVLDGQLAPISSQDHDRLLEEHPVEPDQPLIDFPDRGFDPIDEAPSSAELVAESQSARVRVAITEHELAGLDLVMQVLAEDGNGGGSGYPLRDLRTPALQLMWFPDAQTGFTLGGVMPPGVDVEDITITDRSTGATLVPEQLTAGGIPGSDHQLFIAVVPGTSQDLRVEVTFPTPEGERTFRP